MNFIADLERQILGEPNQVRTLPKWELKRVYWNLIQVIDITLKFTAHGEDLDEEEDEEDGDNLDDGEDQDEEDVDYGP